MKLLDTSSENPSPPYRAVMSQATLTVVDLLPGRSSARCQGLRISLPPVADLPSNSSEATGLDLVRHQVGQFRGSNLSPD